jgi:hypothetical protein
MVSNPFPTAAGYGNMPNGVFSPDLFAQEALYYFRQLSIVDDITTSEYEGQIAEQGDTVHIRKQPKVTVRSYTRGTKLQLQNLVDEELTLIIDQGNYFFYPLDDVMMKQADVDYESLAGESAAYELRDAYDRDILSYMVTQINPDNIVGASGTEETIGYGVGNDFTPLDALNRLNRILDENNVPSSGRWFVASPAFYEALGKEVGTMVKSKGVLDQSIHGFVMFKTNNAPVNANGKPFIMAGHVGAVATATQLIKNETLVNPDDFGMLYRGLHVFGRKGLRPSTMAGMHISIEEVTS